MASIINTKQTDSGWNAQSFNRFPGYTPWNPFKKKTESRNQVIERVTPNSASQPATSAFGGAWRPTFAYNLPTAAAVAPIAYRQNALQQNMFQPNRLQTVQSAYPVRTATPNNNLPTAGAPANAFQYNRTYWSTGNQSHDTSFYRRAGQNLVNDWRSAGGYNIPITDWFDPYDPAGSPYQQSQYMNVPETAGGYGGWGGWGGYSGGGGYTPQDSAAFYSGNYTQRRNRWSETLLTWGLRQQ